MASKGYRVFGLAVLMCLLLAAPAAHAQAVNCNTVVGAISPCLTYLTAKVARPTANCCNGVRRLNSLARTRAQRRAGCACLRARASSIRGLVANRVSALAGACSVRVPFPINTNTNCNTLP